MQYEKRGTQKNIYVIGQFTTFPKRQQINHDGLTGCCCTLKWQPLKHILHMFLELLGSYETNAFEKACRLYTENNCK